MAHFLLFPGQGAQRPGMLAPWAELPSVQEAVSLAEELLGEPLGHWMLEGPAERLAATAVAQPALLVLGYGVARALLEGGIAVAGAAGHSLGEITALTVAGAIDLADAIRLTRLRGEAMQAAVPQGEGAMVALVGLEHREVAAAVAEAAQVGVVAIAGDNAPNQQVVSGQRAAVEAAVAAAKERGCRRAVPLEVSAPFHSPLMLPAAERLASFLADLELREPAFPVWSNVLLRPYASPAEIRRGLVDQVTAPVRWREQVAAMAAAVPDALPLELPPAGVLRGLGRLNAPSWPVEALRDPRELTRYAA